MDVALWCNKCMGLDWIGLDLREGVSNKYRAPYVANNLLMGDFGGLGSQVDGEEGHQEAARESSVHMCCLIGKSTLT